MRFDWVAAVLIFGWIVAGIPASGHANSITIKVINEHNNGIYSRVYYNDGTQPPPFFNTDEKGDVLQAPATCGKVRTLHAHPFDSGAYFDSPEEPCATKVTLRVLSRHTPKGVAINYEIFPVTLRDGSSGVVTLKAALDSKFADTSKGSKLRCEVQLYAFADQQLFKVEGETWTGLAQATTPFSYAFAGAEQPDKQFVTLPYRCDATGERVRTLKSDAADLLDKSVKKEDPVRIDNTFRSWVFENDLKLK